MKNHVIIVLSAVFVLAISSCKRKDPDNTVTPTQTGKAKLEFFNVVGGSNLNMGNQWYKNENNDSFTVSRFDYYITNVVLTGTDGKNYTEKESYHLLRQSDLTTTAFDLADVPYGKYKSVTFMLGVDSLRNTSGAQTGALDPLNGMFWTWNSGYIMLKMEGTSPASQSGLEFHIGGFSGANNVVRTITLTFPDAIEVSGSTPHVHISADVLAMFKSPNKISFATMNAVNMPGAQAKMIADNYANMFSVTYAGL